MNLAAGVRLGSYEILGPLGAGGMGEVYKARDTRLQRVVAVKVLSPELAADPERLRRFEKESRAVSALSHPNIVAVYDIGSTDSIAWIAMEFVDGHSLQNVLLSGPLSIRRILDIAVDVAAGLASAHEAGIVHRDVKPGNLMVSKDGFVKIVDFGLAKTSPPPGGPDSAFSTGTKPGRLVGTLEYMSPEQAGGEPLDFRSDQFAFGAVLYEMATGRRPFRRDTTELTLNAIRNEEPEPLNVARPEVPPPLRWVIERCLSKRPEERFASTRDLAAEMATIRNRISELGGVAPTPQRPLASSLIVSAIIAGLGGFIVASNLQSVPPTAPAFRFNVYPPAQTPFNFESSAPAPAALSPDGRLLAFGARDASGRNLLWVRPLAAVDARPILGTDGATYPFWSGDSRFLGFFADGKLKKVAAEGGPPQALSDAPSGRGGTWNRDGVIVFAPDTEGALHRVSSAGGTSTPVTRLDPDQGHVGHRWPAFLPDGRHFLFFALGSAASAARYAILVGALDALAAKPILSDASNASYAAGYLLFVRDRTLMAAPFDAGKLQTTGEPMPVVEQVNYHPYRLNGAFTASDAGVLAYQAAVATGTSRIGWVDRTGRPIGLVGAAGDYGGLRISPDGTRCAIEVRDSRMGAIDIWIMDFARAIATRVTSGAAVNDSPSWAPSGSEILFTSKRQGRYDLYKKTVDGAGSEEVVLESDYDKTPTDWSPDGRFIAFNRGDARSNRREIFYLAVRDGSLAPFLATRYDERDGRFSPDGRWLAYTSDESGAREVYVGSFPGRESKRRISTGGGAQPVWRRDGRELFYVAADGRMMAVDVSGPDLKAGTPRALFDSHLMNSSSDIALYDVSLDGRRFLVNTQEAQGPPAPITVVVNWTASLRR